MQHDAYRDSDSRNADICSVAKRALLDLLEPLAGFILDCGLSAGELHAIVREAVVRSAAATQLEQSDRVNISGIAATTGIPRAQISRILKAAPQRPESGNEGQSQSTNRILAAWHADPKFTDPNGKPAELRLYGRGITFEALAKKYGLGIPTRAVLDELLRTGATELLPTHKVRAKSSVAVERGMSAPAVKAFGDRATELLSTMLANMRNPDSPQFVANVSDSSISPHDLPLFRKEVSLSGGDFLAEILERLSQKTSGRESKNRERRRARLSVTVFCHESLDGKKPKGTVCKKRKNFRRES